VQLQNGLECLLEEAHIKVLSLVSICSAPVRAACCARSQAAIRIRRPSRRGSPRLHATPDQLRDALGACTDLHPVYRRLLAVTLDELDVIEAHIRQLDEELARLLQAHQNAVERLAAVPGLGVDSAQQIIAEVGPTASTFASGQTPGLMGWPLSGARRAPV
jgi:transposase